MTERIIAALTGMILCLFLFRRELKNAIIHIDSAVPESSDDGLSMIVEHEKSRLSWLRSPLTCDGRVVLEGLDPTRLSDTDLHGVCLRMHVILNSIENAICEGRLIPARLFDRIDTLEDLVLNRREGGARLSDWFDLIEEFGVHYGLTGSEAIAVDSTLFQEAATRYAISK